MSGVGHGTNHGAEFRLQHQSRELLVTSSSPARSCTLLCLLDCLGPQRERTRGRAAFVQGWVIACWTCLGKLAPRGQRQSRVYLSSEWMCGFPLPELCDCRAVSASRAGGSEGLLSYFCTRFKISTHHVTKCFGWCREMSANTTWSLGKPRER